MGIKENLIIRKADISDVALLCQWWNSGEVMAHAGFPNGLGTTVDDVSTDLLSRSEDIFQQFILEVDHTPIGEMSRRNKGSGIAEIGIKICEVDWQGKGYGTLFLEQFIRQLFDEGYQKIILDTNLNNLRAQHVYEKLGFEKLRVNKDSWKNQLGEKQSSVDYELNRADFYRKTDE